MNNALRPKEECPQSYIDFELRLDEFTRDAFRVSASSCLGDSERNLEVQFQCMQGFFGDLYLTQETAREIGEELREILLSGDVGDLYQRVRGDGRPVRFLISLPSEASRLHDIPFELLHDGKAFLARNDRHLLVRFLRVKATLPEPGIEPPLRVLFTCASPQRRRPLNVEAEETAIREALNPLGKAVKFDVIRELTYNKLERVYRGAKNDGRPFHIWHHAGHGEIDSDGNFRLLLEGLAQELPVERLHEIISQNQALRLAVINVCDSGSSAGLATWLARLAVPAAIGISSKIYDAVASQLPQALYSSLGSISVEQAVSQARSALNDSESYAEWSKLLLYSRYRSIGPLLLSKIITPPNRGREEENSTSNKTEIQKGKDIYQVTEPGRTSTKAGEAEGYRSEHTSKASRYA